MNKKEKYIYNQFFDSIKVNYSFEKLKINNKIKISNKKIIKYDYFKIIVQFSFVLVLMFIVIFDASKKTNIKNDASFSIVETANSEACFVEYNNQEYELSIIANNNYTFNENLEKFDYNKKTYYILMKNDNSLILYSKSANIYYLATKIN